MNRHAGLANSQIRAVAEAVVALLEERGLVSASKGPARVLDAAEVARLLGRDRQWVYDHAGELGAFRFGDGPKARIGFELGAVELWKRERQIRQPKHEPARRRHRGSARRTDTVKLIPYDAAGGRP